MQDEFVIVIVQFFQKIILYFKSYINICYNNFIFEYLCKEKNMKTQIIDMGMFFFIGVLYMMLKI